METKTCFDLTAAIENWRAELAVQSDLTTEVRRELETHLRDSIAELGRRGLNEEEAFWVARKRVGKPGQLGEEFVKADPSAVWGERVFWMILAVLLVWLWNGTAGILALLINVPILKLASSSPHSAWAAILTNWFPYVIQVLIRVLPVCWLALFLAKGRINARFAFLSFFHSRVRLAVVGGIWSFTNCGFVVWSSYVAYDLVHASGRTSYSLFPVMQSSLTSLCFPMAILGLLLSLMPKRFEEKPALA